MTMDFVKIQISLLSQSVSFTMRIEVLFKYRLWKSASLHFSHFSRLIIQQINFFTKNDLIFHSQFAQFSNIGTALSFLQFFIICQVPVPPTGQTCLCRIVSPVPFHLIAYSPAPESQCIVYPKLFELSGKAHSDVQIFLKNEQWDLYLLHSYISL